MPFMPVAAASGGGRPKRHVMRHWPRAWGLGHRAMRQREAGRLGSSKLKAQGSKQEQPQTRTDGHRRKRAERSKDKNYRIRSKEEPAAFGGTLRLRLEADRI